MGPFADWINTEMSGKTKKQNKDQTKCFKYLHKLGCKQKKRKPWWVESHQKMQEIVLYECPKRKRKHKNKYAVQVYSTAIDKKCSHLSNNRKENGFIEYRTLKLNKFGENCSRRNLIIAAEGKMLNRKRI